MHPCYILTTYGHVLWTASDCMEGFLSCGLDHQRGRLDMTMFTCDCSTPLTSSSSLLCFGLADWGGAGYGKSVDLGVRRIPSNNM